MTSPKSTDFKPFEVAVLPMGNLLSSDIVKHRQMRVRSLGLLSVLSDAMLTHILDTLVTTTDARDAMCALASFGAASSGTHAFAADDDLWRRLAFAIFTPSRLAHAPFTHSWRATVLRLHIPSTSPPTLPASSTSVPAPSACSTAVVYSDILFHKARCRRAAIDPTWLRYDDIPRVSAATLSLSDFRSRFETPRRPVVLTHAMDDWPALENWSPHYLETHTQNLDFNAGGFDFSFADYMRYCDAVTDGDDQPLYIFDSRFVEKAPHLAKDYSLPAVFAEDLFGVLGAKRPAFRWLIVGPPRSGSSFHKDPNATSAWNAAVHGRKKWLFFPPDVTPPGITPSADGADVTAPVSVMEWFVNFYDRDMIERLGALECVAQPGEIVFVPRGWWHCVLNLDVSVAITQNFVSSVNVAAVVRWVRERPEQVSGCKSPDDAAFLSASFASLVVERYPHLREKLRFALPEECKELSDAKDVVPAVKRRKTTGLWQSLRTLSAKESSSSALSASTTATSFSFGF